MELREHQAWIRPKITVETTLYQSGFNAMTWHWNTVVSALHNCSNSAGQKRHDNVGLNIQ